MKNWFSILPFLVMMLAMTGGKSVHDFTVNDIDGKAVKSIQPGMNIYDAEVKNTIKQLLSKS